MIELSIHFEKWIRIWIISDIFVMDLDWIEQQLDKKVSVVLSGSLSHVTMSDVLNKSTESMFYGKS